MDFQFNVWKQLLGMKPQPRLKANHKFIHALGASIVEGMKML